MSDQAQTDKPRPPGLVCPRCGCADLRVVNTKQRANRVSRRRECRHCGKRITTSEKLVGG